MNSVFISMFIFALIGAISPGPVNIIATSSGAAFGFRQTLPHITGATIAYTLIVFMAGSGLMALLKWLPSILWPLQYFGAAFLLYMSFKIATAQTADTTRGRVKKPPLLFEGILSQGLNPKAWLVAISGVSIFFTASPGEKDYLFAFYLISFVVCFFSIATWAAIGQLIQKYLSDNQRRVMFNRVMGLLLVSSILTLFQ